MFNRDWQKSNVKKGIPIKLFSRRMIALITIILMILSLTGCTIPIASLNNIENAFKDTTRSNIEDYIEEFGSESLIRFHVIANSDSEEDQLLKYVVRDEILKMAAPLLAESKSLEESRQMLKELENDFIHIANSVVQEYGKNYEVTIDHGKHIFPTKSYGSIVLPGGEYEAVKIQIGEAEGENWWCVLFPPICFVNVEESTTVSVDEKPGIPLDKASEQIAKDADNTKDDTNENTIDKRDDKPKVKFFLSRFF